MTIKGSCLCGEVRFEVESLTGPFEICHCNRCRKVSGSQGIAAVGCSPSTFRITSGNDSIQTYSAPLIEKPPVYSTHFCSKCGSPLPDPAPTGDFMEIPAGLLDTEPGLVPDKHIYVDFNAEWNSIDDNLPKLTKADIYNLRHA